MYRAVRPPILGKAGIRSGDEGSEMYSKISFYYIGPSSALYGTIFSAVLDLRIFFDSDDGI